MQEIDPYSTMEAQTIDHLTPEMVEALAEGKPIIASDVWSDMNPSSEDDGTISVSSLDELYTGGPTKFGKDGT